MKKVISLLVLIPSFVLACDTGRGAAETQFVIDPAAGLLRQESKINNTQFEISRCESDEKYVLINFNTIYFQVGTARVETVAGNLLEKESTCSIQSEIPFQKVEYPFLDQLVKSRHHFLKSCVRIVMSELRGQKIMVHPKSDCQLKSLDTVGSVVETNEASCIIAVTPSSRIAVEAKINPDCLQSSFLEQNQIQPGDVESVIRITPIGEENGQLQPKASNGLRYVRHTILPAKGFMPRAVKDDEKDFPYISVLSTNISPGNISVMPMGPNTVEITPTFLVENMSKEFCKDGLCARPSSFVAPISASVTLSKINPATNKKSSIGDWTHSLKIPADWSGLAELNGYNNLTGLSMGALKANVTLKPDEIYTLEAKFYEPRSHLDDLSYTNNFFDLNSNLDVKDVTDDALPTLPDFGRLGRLNKIPTLPTVSLGRAGVLEFTDRFNATKSWTQKYDRVCNAQNLKCVKLEGSGKPFVVIKMSFKIGPNKEVIPLKVSKVSEVFGSYEQNVQSFATKVCE